VTNDASGPEHPEEPGSQEPPAPEASVSVEDDGRERAETEDEPEKKHLPVWQESILLLGIALALAIVIKTFFVQAFYIPSQSMEPGLIENDRILVQKVSYWFGGDPQRGDVIVFEDPGGWLSPEEDKSPTGVASWLSKIGLYPTGGHLVKRVIGTEGDVIKCCDDKGRIEVNGQPIDEDDFLAKREGECDAVLPSGAGQKPCDWTVGPVPAGKVFVMGDNRTQSADSRYHMCAPDQDPCTQSPWVDTDLVVGKVFALVWPQSRWTWISRPGDFDDVPDDPPADSK
jgi:signal peptidase I